MERRTRRTDGSSADENPSRIPRGNYAAFSRGPCAGRSCGGHPGASLDGEISPVPWTGIDKTNDGGRADMNSDNHDRARQLLLKGRIEGISDPDRQWLNAHLAHCADCSREADALESTIESIREFSIMASPDL